MAVNNSRSMNLDFHQGIVDNTYISLTPNRGGVVENPPIDRLAWPAYGRTERHIDHPHVEAAIVQATKPVEYLKAPDAPGNELRY